MKYFWSLITAYILVIALTSRADVAIVGTSIAGWITYLIKTGGKNE